MALKIKIYLIFSFIITTFLTYSQENDGLKYCGQSILFNKYMEDPAFAQQYLLDQQQLSAMQEIIENNPELQRGTVYKIPIVFHVLHNNGTENISKEQILDALRILNRDYRKQNPDTISVVSDFKPLIADIEIEFVLATKAPNGTCFDGITRTVSAMTFDGSNGFGQVTAIKNGNNVYQGEWPGNKYLNVFICADIGGAAGYTMQPNNWGGGTSMSNGIWVLHDYVGSIGTGSEGKDRTLTHETGHWLNLAHTWGDSNEPGLASNCNTDDGVTDTPNTRGVVSCNLGENYCGPKANVENYMDYSYCSKMFTTGQKNRMRSAITSSVGGRNNLWQASNLTATGADGVLTLCKAEFTSSKNIVCVGDVVTFTDLSYNIVDAWDWSFEGASQQTSTSQNPTATYTTPGNYDVTLTAHNGSQNQTTTKSDYIKVLPQSSDIPFYEGFEEYSSLINNNYWSVSNPQNNQAFDIVTNVGHTGVNSVKLTNYNQSADSEDELQAPPVDLSDISGSVTLSFRFSYRKKASSNSEKLQVLGTNNCGDTWNILKNISGTSLGTQVVTNSWTPASQSEWTTVHVTNVTSNYFVDNFMYKFKFFSDGGNNLYIDDINIYPGAPSNEIVLGTEILTNTLNEINIYPNPADKELIIEYQLNSNQNTNIELINSLGQTIHSQYIKSNSGKNIVFLDIEKLSIGLYTVKIQNGKDFVYKKLWIK